MRIFVKNRQWIKTSLDKNPNWFFGKNIISIFSKESYSPFPDRFNVLKLEFDDVTDLDKTTKNANDLIFFNEGLAKQIKSFANEMNITNDFYVHCDAGISRSGAIGYIFNEYFNKFKEINRNDNEMFLMNNKQIMPNPLVVRLLKNEMFGITDYSKNWN